MSRFIPYRGKASEKNSQIRIRVDYQPRPLPYGYKPIYPIYVRPSGTVSRLGFPHVFHCARTRTRPSYRITEYHQIGGGEWRPADTGGRPRQDGARVFLFYNQFSDDLFSSRACHRTLAFVRVVVVVYIIHTYIYAVYRVMADAPSSG